jgi:hypothetical protein
MLFFLTSGVAKPAWFSSLFTYFLFSYTWVDVYLHTEKRSLTKALNFLLLYLSLLLLWTTGVDSPWRDLSTFSYFLWLQEANW